MKILIIGRGWIGNLTHKQLKSRNHDSCIISHKKISIIKKCKWDWVINCAGVKGYPNVDSCENSKWETIKANALFPIELEKICSKYNVRLSHFSSGCIYEGKIQKVKLEPNYFGSTYSISKAISDSYLQNKAQVYRIRMPFTDELEEQNLLCKIIKYSKFSKLIDLGENSLTNLKEAISVAINLIEKNKKNDCYNLVNKGSINMKDLAEMMGIKPVWWNKSDWEKTIKAKRSTCVIPPYKQMSELKISLKKAIEDLSVKQRENPYFF